MEKMNQFMSFKSNQEEYLSQNENQNLNYNNQITQNHEPSTEILKTVEIEKEKNTIMEISFNEAERVIRNHCKIFTQKQEEQKTRSLFLVQQNNDLLQQINEEKCVLDALKFEEEALTTQLNRSNQEITERQQDMQSAEEIVEQLMNEVTNLKTKAKIFQTKNESLIKKIEAQNEQFANSIEAKIKEIRRLKKILVSEKKPENYASLIKENILLEKEMLEKRAYLEKLAERFLQLAKSYERNDSLEKEKQNLTDQLDIKRNELNGIKKDLDTLATEKDCKINHLKEECENKLQRLDSLKNELTVNNDKIQEYNITKQARDEAIETQNKVLSENREKIKNIKEEISEREKEMQELSEKHNGTLERMKSDLSVLENNLIAMEKYAMDNMQAEDLFTKTFSSKLEKKDTLLKRKITLEEELNSEKLLHEKIQFLNEKISVKNSKINTLNEDLNNLSENKDLVELSKKEAFSKACQNFLSEKTEILQNEKKAIETSLQQITAEVNELKKKVEANQQRDKVEPTSGILKKQYIATTTPSSPKSKKVKFLNAASQSSSSTVDSEFDKDKLFEQLINEAKNRKVPALNAPRKRRLVLTDDD